MKRMSDYGAEATPETQTKALVASNPETKAQVAQQQREAEAQSIHVAKMAASEALDEVRELIGEVKALRLQGRLRDAGRSAKDLATTAGILIDKSLLLEGRPTAITETRDAEDIWRSIAKRANIFDAEADAEELPPGA